MIKIFLSAFVLFFFLLYIFSSPIIWATYFAYKDFIAEEYCVNKQNPDCCGQFIQIIGSYHGSDSGLQSHPDETCYQRLFIAPGIEIKLNKTIQFYADFRIPIVTTVTGNQLIAPALVNASINISL
jgi:hypothetical protein